MKGIVRVIDSITEWAGKVGSWFAVALVALMVFGVVMRYVFGTPLLWVFEISVMLGASLYAVGFSYAHKQGAHIRVDLIYACLSTRKKALIDILGALFVFFPLMILVTQAAWDSMWHSWATGERMPITGWYPHAGPLRTMIMVGFGLLLLQGMAQFIRDLNKISGSRGKSYD
jgi:TRAP-type mannitol/chloroaromatic compound transport system permease small subunit